MKGGLLLLGGGGHCRSVIDVLELVQMPIAGIVYGRDCSLTPVFGYPVLGRDSDLPKLRQHYSHALITVGQIKSSSTRERLFQQLTELGFLLPSVVSPLAHVSRHSKLGAGTVVMHHALVNADAVVGENCIINSKSLIEHGCCIGKHCHIAVGAVLCGNVVVGDGSFIGAGALVHPQVSVGRQSFISMGERILKSTEDYRK